MVFATEKEREQFILDNINLAYKVATKLYYQDTCFDFDDVKQECVIGLIKAVDAYDDSYNTKFSTLANTCIYRCAISAIKKCGYEMYHNPSKTSYKATNFSDLNNIDGEPSVADDYVDENTMYAPFYLAQESQDAVDRLLQIVKEETYFSENTYNYLRLVMLGFTQTDIAKLYNVSRQAVSCSLNSLLDYIYDRFEVKGKILIQ